MKTNLTIKIMNQRLSTNISRSLRISKFYYKLKIVKRSHELQSESHTLVIFWFTERFDQQQKIYIPSTVFSLKLRERSGSVVECLTRDRRAAGSSLTGVTALLSLSKTHLS